MTYSTYMNQPPTTVRHPRIYLLPNERSVALFDLPVFIWFLIWVGMGK